MVLKIWVYVCLGNGLLPVWCQVKTWANVDFLLMEPSGTYFSEMFFKICFRENAFDIVVWKMSAILFRSQTRVCVIFTPIYLPLTRCGHLPGSAWWRYMVTMTLWHVSSLTRPASSVVRWTAIWSSGTCTLVSVTKPSTGRHLKAILVSSG